MHLLHNRYLIALPVTQSNAPAAVIITMMPIILSDIAMSVYACQSHITKQTSKHRILFVENVIFIRTKTLHQIIFWG